MLSHTSEYALRALSKLAQLSRGESLFGRELAQSTSIPPKYLSKIMLSLRNAGLVMDTRGTGGAYMLLRPADAIHLIDVVQLFEGPAARPQCLLGAHKECSEKDPCTAHESWGRVRKTYLDFLEHTTLYDISHQRLHESQITPARRGGRPQ